MDEDRAAEGVVPGSSIDADAGIEGVASHDPQIRRLEVVLDERGGLAAHAPLAPD